MKLLLLTMPALVLVTVLSANIQGLAGGGRDSMQSNGGALPEATRIITRQVNEANIERKLKGLPPIQLMLSEHDTEWMAP